MRNAAGVEALKKSGGLRRSYPKLLMSEKIFETNLGLVIYKKFWVSGVWHIYE